MLTPDFLTGRFFGEQKLGNLKDTKTKYFSLQNLSTINKIKQKRSDRKLETKIRSYEHGLDNIFWEFSIRPSETLLRIRQNVEKQDCHLHACSLVEHSSTKLKNRVMPLIEDNHDILRNIESAVTHLSKTQTMLARAILAQNNLRITNKISKINQNIIFDTITII